MLASLGGADRIIVGDCTVGENTGIFSLICSQLSFTRTPVTLLEAKRRVYAEEFIRRVIFGQ
jgi:hypothetical protein